VGDLAGVSPPTVSRIIRKVSNEISILVQNFITFPTTQRERSETMTNFYALAKFPGVLGAINCTHVAIRSPGGNDAELYRNRKGYFSVNVQAICNASLEVSNIVARWPGSVHDSTIFGNSRICAQFESDQIVGGYILGDGGYACKTYLLTPLAQTTTDGEKRYNFRQIRTRNPVERLFGVVKRRFPCLQLGLRTKLATSFKIIVACFILHNIAIQHGDTDAPDDHSLLLGRRVYEDVPVLQNRRATAAGATAMCTALIMETFSRP